MASYTHHCLAWESTNRIIPAGLVASLQPNSPRIFFIRLMVIFENPYSEEGPYTTRFVREISHPTNQFSGLVWLVWDTTRRVLVNLVESPEQALTNLASQLVCRATLMVTDPTSEGRMVLPMQVLLTCTALPPALEADDDDDLLGEGYQEEEHYVQQEEEMEGLQVEADHQEEEEQQQQEEEGQQAAEEEEPQEEEGQQAAEEQQQEEQGQQAEEEQQHEEEGQQAPEEQQQDAEAGQQAAEGQQEEEEEGGGSKQDDDKLEEPATTTVIEEKGMMCTICLEEMNAGSTASSLHCQHCFHETCIAEWFTYNSSCPNCRSSRGD